MVEIKINKVEKSQYNDSLIAYFTHREREEFIIFSRNVLNYLNIKSVHIDDIFFAIKSNRNSGYIWLAKKKLSNEVIIK